MRTEYAKQLIQGVAAAEEIARTFRNLLHSLYKADPRVYRKLFLKKQTVLLTEIKPAVKRTHEIESLFEYGLLSRVGSDLVCSQIMVHRNVMDIENPALNPRPMGSVQNHEGAAESEWFIATDWPDISPDTSAGRDAVFPIHYESVRLLGELGESVDSRPAFDLSNKRVLDIFCGSGIFGIYAALKGAEEVFAADINERALAFVRFNAILNDISPKIKISQSNIFSHIANEDLNVNGQKFDLILANAPFEPIPSGFESKYFTHSYGGDYGDLVLQPFLEQVANYLAEDGTLLAVLFACGDEGGPSIDCWKSGSGTPSRQLRLGKAGNLTGRIEDIDSVPLEQFALHLSAKTPEDKEKVDAWLHQLMQNGLDRLHLALLVLRKVPGKAAIEQAVSTYLPGCDWTVPLNWYLPCGFPNTERVKVLLIDPPFHSYFPRDSVMRDQGRYLEIPSNYLYLATYLVERFPQPMDDLKLLHFDYELFRKKEKPEDITLVKDEEVLQILREVLREFNPDIVGIGGFTVQAAIVAKILWAVRELSPDALTIGGGPHISFTCDDFLVETDHRDPLLDLAVIGEGEYALEDIIRGYLLHGKDRRQFLQRLQKTCELGCHMPRNTISRHSHNAILVRTRAMDFLPMNFEFLGNHNPKEFLSRANIIIHTKRGCQNRCKFCISSKFFTKAPNGVREVIRPVDYVCTELRQLSDFGCEVVEILDETFDPRPPKRNGVPNSQYALCKRLACEDFSGMRFVVQTRAKLLTDITLPIMKAARITTVLVGVESASDAVLQKVRKGQTFKDIELGIRRAKTWGMKVGAFWIIGLPGATAEDDLRTIRTIAQVSGGGNPIVDWHEVNLFVPYPGTEYYERDIAGQKDKAVKSTVGFRLLGKPPYRYQEWQRFGQVRTESGEFLPVSPVFTTSIYPAERISEIWESVKKVTGLVNPKAIPVGTQELREVALWKGPQFFLQVLETFALRIARGFERSIAESHVEDHKQTFQERFTHLAKGVLIDLNSPATAESIHDLLDELNKWLPKWLSDSNEELQVKSLIIAPFIIPDGNEIEALESKDRSMWFTRRKHGEDWLEVHNRTSLHDQFEEDCRYFVIQYLTYSGEPWLDSRKISHDAHILFRPNECVRSDLYEKNVTGENPAQWLVAFGFGPYPKEGNSCSHDERNLQLLGVEKFLFVAAQSLMSNLASRLALRIESEEQEKQLAYNVDHVMHDVKNIILPIVEAKNLQMEMTSTLTEFDNRLRTRHEGATKEHFYDELCKMWRLGGSLEKESAAIAEHIDRVFKVISCFHMMSKGKPDQQEGVTSYSICNQIARVIATKIDESGPKYEINGKAPFNFGDTVQVMAQSVTLDDSKTLPTIAAFEIGLSEILSNAHKHSPVSSMIKLEILVTNDTILMDCVNEVEENKLGLGLGQKRLKAIAKIHNGLSDVNLSDCYSSGKECIEGKDYWRTRLLIRNSLYQKQISEEEGDA